MLHNKVLSNQKTAYILPIKPIVIVNLEDYKLMMLYYNVYKTRLMRLYLLKLKYKSLPVDLSQIWEICQLR